MLSQLDKKVQSGLKAVKTIRFNAWATNIHVGKIRAAQNTNYEALKL